MAEDLLDTMPLFGPIRRGVANAVVLVGAAGHHYEIVAASFIAMPVFASDQLRYGYALRIASDVIVACGTLVQIIHPCSSSSYSPTISAARSGTCIRAC